MTFMVPFDGTSLSKAALARARQYAIALEEAPDDVVRWLLPDQHIDVVAVSVVPESARYAREKGWIREDEEFSTRRVVEDLHRQVTDLTPNANFQYIRVDGSAGAGTISSRLRNEAEDLETSVMFIGSENAGRIVTPLSNVGRGLAADQDYDVHLVRRPIPPRTLRRLKSDFFIPR